MKKRLPLFLMEELLIIDIITSCEEPNVQNSIQRLDLLPDLMTDLADDIKTLYDKYDVYSDRAGGIYGRSIQGALRL